MKKKVGFIPAPAVVVEDSELLKKFDLTWGEVKEYAKLKAIIFGKSGPFKALFVELDDKNEDHQRYEELSRKMIHLHAYLLSRRNEDGPRRTLADRITSRHHDE